MISFAVEHEPVCSRGIWKSSESPLMAKSDTKEEGREQKFPSLVPRPSTPPDFDLLPYTASDQKLEV